MLHEIKHDGFRVIARKDGPRVRLYSRPGNVRHPALSPRKPRKLCGPNGFSYQRG
jgi:hypothetical protein